MTKGPRLLGLGVVSLIVMILLTAPAGSATSIPAASTWTTLSQGSTGYGLNIVITPTFTSETATFSQNSTNFLHYPASGAGVATVSEQVGFNSATFAKPPSGADWVNSTWDLSANVFAGLHCYNYPGAGNYTLRVLLEENVFDLSTGSWVLTSNVTSLISISSYSAVCSAPPHWVWEDPAPYGNNPVVYAITGTSTIADQFTLSAASTYFVSTAVLVVTSANETGAADLWIYSCVNFASGSGCSYPSGSSTGKAELTSITVG